MPATVALDAMEAYAAAIEDATAAAKSVADAVKDGRLSRAGMAESYQATLVDLLQARITRGELPQPLESRKVR